MPFAIATIAGTSLAAADICKVPAGPVQVPTPFVNEARHLPAITNTSSVLIDQAPALNLGSEIPLSSGDEGGVAGGVVSGSVIGACKFTQGSSLVTINGLPAVFLTCPTTQNDANAFGLVNDAGQTVATTES
ncbi:MAG: DUF4150 domain-containing protein [Myxococcota bacterium]